jgi:hypothetical protein
MTASVSQPEHRAAGAERGTARCHQFDLAPVLLGSGTPHFARLASTPVRLDEPEVRRAE